MILKIFSIYDSKAEAFIQPFFSQATGAAIRSFESAANEESSDFHKYGADYTLFELGSFNQSTGEMIALDAHINLGLAITFVKEQRQLGHIMPDVTKDMIEQRESSLGMKLPTGGK